MSGPPKGWTAQSLGSVLTFNYGKSLPGHARKAGAITVYGSNGPVGYHNKALVNGPAIIVGRKGSIGEVHYSTGSCWPIDTTYFIDDFGDHSPQFWFWYLKHLQLGSLDRATAIPGLNREDAYQSVVLVPPPQEQRRIVAKLDSLFKRSKGACKELARIPRLVERYKQAILAAAFRGAFTTEWRPNHDNNAIQLLKEINISPLSDSNLSKIPSNWLWVRAGDLCFIKGGITLGKKRPPGTTLVERPYLRVANVQRGWLDLAEIKPVSLTEREAEALRLQPGDVLMNEGGDRDKLGRGWVWEGQIPDCVHQNHVFRLRPKSALVPSRYISYYANEFGQTYFLREGKQTTNLASISMTKLSGLPIPLAPPDEMQAIVEKIESYFSVIERLGAETARATALVDRLEQATLAKAFRGELVLSDPQREIEDSQITIPSASWKDQEQIAK